jgi:cytochrome c-type biogenesis protein CcmH/NrfF
MFPLLAPLPGEPAPMTSIVRELRRFAATVTRCMSLAALILSAAIVTPAQQTDRAKNLGKQLMCVCSCNQVLTACNHVGCSYSHSMLKELDDRVARGESDDLTLQGFVQEYGATVLSEPPSGGFNRLAWIVPIVAPLLALYLLWEVVRRWRRRAALAPAAGTGVSPELLSQARRETDEGPDE